MGVLGGGGTLLIDGTTRSKGSTRQRADINNCPSMDTSLSLSQEPSYRCVTRNAGLFHCLKASVYRVVLLKVFCSIKKLLVVQKNRGTH